MKENLHFEILSGRLPAGNHHFSVLIFSESDGEASYYELKPKFFGDYPASVSFKRIWNFVVRPTRVAARSVAWRARHILSRACIKPIEVRYMTTLVMPASGRRPLRYRHVTGVRLLQHDFKRLLHDGMLREMYRGAISDKEAQRDALFGLSPIILRVAKTSEQAEIIAA